MANKNLFASMPKFASDSKNEAGGNAYSMNAKQALANYACTGCFGNTFYTNADDQLNKVMELVQQVEPEFVAKVAVYSRKNSYMKDMPAVLLAYLCSNQNSFSDKDKSLFRKTFFNVCDNMKMVRNFMQIIRSGVFGRKSFGTKPKQMINAWLDKQTDESLFRQSIGNSPSFADVIKMVHPRPSTEGRNALYAYFIGKKYSGEALPELVVEFENFKKDLSRNVPKIPFEMLTALQLTDNNWLEIASKASWTQIVKNLNTFQRHNVYKNENVVSFLARKIADREEILSAKTFPYQLLSAFINAENIPDEIVLALHNAMEISVENIPEIKGKTFIFADVSGSMRSSITGSRGTATSKMTCVHIAALVASAFFRRNLGAEVIPFSDKLYNVKLNRGGSIVENAKILYSLPSGGTNCSLPLKYINDMKAEGSTIIYISDNESFIDTDSNSYERRAQKATQTMEQWNIFKNRNKDAKLICNDIQPNITTQAKGKDILNIGGFNGQVFDVMANFINSNEKDNDAWVKQIDESVKI